ncbi:MAG: RNase P modulator RnpM [Bacillota bacterium]
MKKRRIPLRLCLGCREMKPKKELIRVVRTPEGTVDIDLTGKKAGRGAYICPDPACFDQAVKAKSLEKALEQSLSPEILATLRQTLLESAGRKAAPDGPAEGPTGIRG